MKTRLFVVDFFVIKQTKKERQVQQQTKVSFELASIGPHVNGVYNEIRLPRFLIRVLIFVKKKLAITLNHSEYS